MSDLMQRPRGSFGPEVLVKVSIFPGFASRTRLPLSIEFAQCALLAHRRLVEPEQLCAALNPSHNQHELHE
jgi:hypothetical protein